jgi:DNA-binding HxlR family transcriptional regulator
MNDENSIESIGKEALQEVELMQAIQEIVKKSPSQKDAGWIHLDDPEKMADILEMMGENLTRQILITLNKQKLSALELKKLFPFAPKTTLYRKINELESRGLIKIDNFSNRGTKKIAIYKSTISGIHINMKDDIALLIYLK